MYDYVSRLPMGEVITFGDMCEVVDHDVKTDRSVVYQANKHLLNDMDRMLVSVRRVGYKVATPTEQLGHAGTRPLRAKRQIRKGIREANNIDKEKLSPEEKKYQMDLMVKLQVSMQVLNKRQVEALKKQQKALNYQEEAITEQRNTQEAIKDIQKQLDDLKKSIDE